MAGFEIKSDHYFIDEPSDVFSHLAKLEQQFVSQCAQIAEKNQELRERNRELVESAELGITAEAELKKMTISAQELIDEVEQLHEEIKNLNYKLEHANQAYRNLQKESEKRQRRADESEQSLRAEIKAKSDQIASLTTLMKQSEKAIKSFRDQASNHNANLSESRTEMAGLRHSINELKFLCEGQKEQLLNKTRELEEAFAQLKSLESEKTSIVEGLKASYEAEIAHLKNQFQKKFKDISTQVKNERVSAQQQLKAAQKAFELQLSELASIGYTNESQLAVLKGELRTKEECIESLASQLNLEKANAEKLKASFDQQLSEMAKAGFYAESKIGQLRGQVDESSRAAQKATFIIAEKERTLSSLQYEVSNLKRMIAALEKTATEYRVEINSQKVAIAQYMTLISDLNQSGQAKDSAIQSLKEELWTSQIELKNLKQTHEEQIRSALRELNEKLEDKNKSLSESLRETGELKEKLKVSEQSEALLRKTVEEMSYRHEIEKESLCKTISELSERDQTERQKLTELGLQLRHREVQLRHYASSVAKEKNEIVQCARQLADEVRSARTLSPLKDYLSLTEFEMSKTELQLKKTPTISLERARLESVLTQLHEQREFLKKSISKSRTQLDEQAANLLKIARSLKAGTIPPLPPGVRDLDPE